MNSFGHIGLTIAAAYPVEQVIRKWLEARTPPRVQQALAGPGSISFDYRLVMLGAMLPDIIDKPLGFVFKPDFVNGGLRTVGHSGVLALAFFCIGALVFLAARNPQILIAALAYSGHLALDEMWRQPRSLFWPLRGWMFPRGSTTLSEWLDFHVNGLYHSSIPEYIGSGVILLFFLYIITSGGVIRFLKSGFVGSPPQA